MDINKIQSLINSNSDEIQFTEKTGGKSIIWNSVYCIKYNNEILKFVSCKKCKKVMSYSGKSGTCNILKHIQSQCKSLKNVPPSMKITPFIETERKVKVAEPHRRKLNELAVSWIAKDIRPFSIVEGVGFKVSTNTLAFSIQNQFFSILLFYLLISILLL